ncbi:hypothetical protein JAAARDRAFT_189417 [Jaapia argillacea MUCL 33604]|uniref:Uncharacterized protein n=1 Tax=Jaapia argillacea MUCL 33604 TaxID=933084 RepID=A0A067Q4Q7_9AGAM|nr:hypothetical protein JAAARDRAFT_189417 [Jaapia argillacea MUCL 33604]
MAALAASPQTAFRPEPSWDEAIVPTLRKRLESESRMLANRLSASSIGDDYFASTPFPQSKLASPITPSQKPSAIPRPSLQLSRTSESISRPNGNTATPGLPPPHIFQRSRTNSQPIPYEPPLPVTNGYGNGSSSSSGRPSDVKPTRIPRARTPSMSGPELLNGANDSRTGSRIGNGYSQQGTAPDSPPYPLDASARSTTSRLPHGQQDSGLLNEPPPFTNPTTPTSYTSSLPPAEQPRFPQYPPQEQFNSDDEMDIIGDYARRSSESEERPFEHWYRGDLARNGGVGELRVARRMEMLEIASYGHSTGKVRARTGLGIGLGVSMGGGGFGSGRNSRVIEEGIIDDGSAGVARRVRKRAESVGARESFYLDTERVDEAGRVLDEHPLTDLEVDGDDYTDGETSFSQSHQQHTNNHLRPRDVGSVSTPSLLSDTQRQRNVSTQSSSRIPTPAPSTRRQGQGSDTPRTPTSSRSVAAASTSRSRAASPTTSRLSPNSAVSNTPNQKKRAKSPAASTASAKKPKKTVNNKSRKEEMRKSVSEYPSPGEGEDADMAYAIPSWTQPKARGGNWDEVVLPVVARKKGLDGYEEADGSPQPRKPEPPAPAPGTFGFDYSKYKPPRTDLTSEDIQMDEFGRPAVRGISEDGDTTLAEQDAPRRPEHQDDRPIKPMGSDSMSLDVEMERARMRMNPPQPPASPLPFSHYAPNGAAKPTHLNQQVDGKEEEEGGAGCCKCVIM